MSKASGWPRWASRVLAEVHRLVALRRVRFTLKAVDELEQLDLAHDEDDALQVLAELTLDDLAERIESRRAPEWLYVFKPLVAGELLYVKLVLKHECVVVSFHRDEADDEDS